MNPAKTVIERVENVLQEESKKIFEELNASLSKDPNAVPQITIKNLGEAIETYNHIIKMPQNTKNTILNYKLVDNIIENKVQNFNPSSFSKENFVDFFSGKDLKNILFDYSLNEKRDKIEILTNLYGMIGGNKEGIERANLVKALKTFYSIVKDPEKHFYKENIQR